MRNFQKKGKWSQIIQSKFFLIFLGMIIFIFIFSMFSLVSKMEETIQNKKIIANKIKELEKTRKNLNSEIDKLKTSEGVEESIREKFGLAKNGENMIMVVDDKNKTKSEENTTSNGFFSFLKNWFK